MRHILTSVVLLVLLFPALALGETMDDLVERDGLHYKKFSTVPFTGKITGQYQGSFRNGKKDDLWVRYYDDGQLFWKGTYKNGTKEGPWVTHHILDWFVEKGTYKDGKKVGPWVGYHDNGQLFTKRTYKNVYYSPPYK